MVQVRTVDISSWTTATDGNQQQQQQQAEREKCVEEFRAAMTELGMVVIVGHGIPVNLLDDKCRSNCQNWFSHNSLATKQKFTRGPYGCEGGGYTARGVEAVAASSSSSEPASQHDATTTTTSTTTSTTIAADADADADAIESFVVRGLPDDSHYSNTTNNALIEVAKDYYPHMCRLLRILHQIMCRALQVEDEDYFHTQGILLPDDDSQTKHSLKFSYYPSPEEEKDNSDDETTAAAAASRMTTTPTTVGLRYGAHTDFQDLTILWPDPNDWTPLLLPNHNTSSSTETTNDDDDDDDDNDDEPIMVLPTTGGLQVWDSVHQQWEPVIISQPHALCVNLADYWNIWSHGHFVSPLHRVTQHGWPLPRERLGLSAAVVMGDDNANIRTASTGGAASPSSTSTSAARSSLVFFSVPNESAIVEPLPGTTPSPDYQQRVLNPLLEYTSSNKKDSNNAGSTITMTAGEHLAMKLARINTTTTTTIFSSTRK